MISAANSPRFGGARPRSWEECRVYGGQKAATKLRDRELQKKTYVERRMPRERRMQKPRKRLANGCTDQGKSMS